MTTRPDLGMDMITKRPRTPRDPYTTLTETQKKNIPKDPGAFFMTSRPERAYPDKGWYRDRYATNTNQYLLRGPPTTHPFCWIDSQWQRDPPEQYNTARLGGTERWGPDKVGSRTVQHFNKSEDSKRFTKPEVYRRHPTNLPGDVWMDYGRPTEGYYAQRNPNSQTWFGSSVPLNRTTVLQDIRPKTRAEYEQQREARAADMLKRQTQWPAYSEYTDRTLLRTRVDPVINTLTTRKKYLEEAALFA
ncbi:uncharacterized protein LOC123526468 isoform X1 [Mercenaria mercenaria]|uniref:uncharacterized protein LOC123526468 isoform X1 n=1 Tax=Mercenaria mercenaria TaxID=6596 RepID=UPI001E1D7851|nr:uncharacterized protein LOC123526468 isoform X1 [Mercenaria mercenaria]